MKIFLAIMDDFLILNKRRAHKDRLEELLKALLKYSLKMSPK